MFMEFFQHPMFLNEKSTVLCDWFLVLSIKLCIHMILFVSNYLRNVINYICIFNIFLNNMHFQRESCFFSSAH